MGASLVVLAAGMGNRYGGLKQIDSFGPNGESLLEYAVYDALQAGFDHMVFIIREDFVDAFREKFTEMLAKCPRYDLVFQEMDPDFAFVETVQREKPWGTLHATLSAAEVVDQPFAVVNADDRYGTSSYVTAYKALQHLGIQEAFIIGYTLENTLSDHGVVNRGICDVEKGGLLHDVKEHYAISRDVTGSIIDRDGYKLVGKEIVSMNFWGFHQNFFEQAQPLFELFVRTHADQPRAEMVIPDGVDVLVKQENLICRVLPSSDGWQGVTNPEDKERVQGAFDGMLQEGVYPEQLR